MKSREKPIMHSKRLNFLALAISFALPSIGFAQRPWVNSAKRGVGMSLAPAAQEANLLKLEKLETPWFYSWGAEPRSGFESLPAGIDFVPMAWGRGGLTGPPPTKVTTWIAGRQAGLYDTLLGFNEPDHASQANMSVNEALDLWPHLEATGLRLGSPATASTNGTWMSQFMDGVESRDLRVDFVAVHRYGGSNPQSFLDYLEDVHNQYNRPIWITELGVADWGATSIEDNHFTDQQVYDFMAAILPALESLDYVERYAWFPAPRSRVPLTHSALFEDDGQFTRLGRLYQGGVQFFNAGFESPDLVPPTSNAQGADNWTTFNAVSVNTDFAHLGDQSLRLAPSAPSGQSNPGIARQEYTPGTDIDINESYSMGAWVFHPSSDPLTGTREGTLRIQWFDTNNNLLGDAKTVAIDANSPTDEWFFVSLENVLIPNNANIEEVRAAIFVNNVGSSSVNSGAAYFDDLVFVQGSSLGLTGDFDGDLDVDGADFLVWQRGGSPSPLSGTDLADWETNFGLAASQSAASHAIPEPATAILLAVIGFVVVVVRRQSRGWRVTPSTRFF